MSFFVSPQAEYRANRLTQLLRPHAVFIAATSMGRVVVNFDGLHMCLFDLDEQGKLKKMDDVVVNRPKATPPVVEIQ